MKKHLLLFILMLFYSSFLGNQLHAQNCSELNIVSTISGVTAERGGTLDLWSNDGFGSICELPSTCQIWMNYGGDCFNCTNDILSGKGAVIPARTQYRVSMFDSAIPHGNPICKMIVIDCGSDDPPYSPPSTGSESATIGVIPFGETSNNGWSSPCPPSNRNCKGDRNPGGERVCGECPIVNPPKVPEKRCKSAKNCKGDRTVVMMRVCECPDIDSPDPVEQPCYSAPSCNGSRNMEMSVCGVCPTIEVPPCPPKHPGTCPPCSIKDTFTGECTFNSTLNECIPIACDDGDPCTSGDILYRNCDGSICEPCAGKLIEIVSIEVVNMRDCDDQGNDDPSDDTFKGDIVVTFNHAPVIEDFIITGDAYFSYKESYCIVNENTITIENRTFDGTGGRITLHRFLNSGVSCSFTKNGLGGQALGPCKKEGNETETVGSKNDCVKSAPVSKGAYIEGITIDQIYKCYDGGTVYKTSDDYLEAKVTVHFGKSLPSKGVLELSGMVAAYVNLYNVGGSSYTFPGRMKLKYKESNTIKVVAADFHSTHASICPIDTYAYYIDDQIFLCDNPCSSSINSTESASSRAVYTNFNAFQQKRHVDLEWLTNQSDKSERYIIERAVNGSDFEVLTEIENTVFTDQNNYFKSLDNLPVLGDNHYRLKQVFMDRHIEYSPVKTVNFGVDLDAISFFPNPAKSELFIDLDEYAGKSGHMMISNQLGTIIEEIDFTEIPEDLIRIDFSNYINGLYFIRVKVDRSKFVAKKVLVSKLY